MSPPPTSWSKHSDAGIYGKCDPPSEDPIILQSHLVEDVIGHQSETAHSSPLLLPSTSLPSRQHRLHLVSHITKRAQPTNQPCLEREELLAVPCLSPGRTRELRLAFTHTILILGDNVPWWSRGRDFWRQGMT